MTYLTIFPFVTGLMELGAAIVYAFDRQYALAFTWFCYALACVALGMAGNR